MFAVKTKSLLLLCSVACFATPASAQLATNPGRVKDGALVQRSDSHKLTDIAARRQDGRAVRKVTKTKRAQAARQNAYTGWEAYQAPQAAHANRRAYSPTPAAGGIQAYLHGAEGGVGRYETYDATPKRARRAAPVQRTAAVERAPAAPQWEQQTVAAQPTRRRVESRAARRALAARPPTPDYSEFGSSGGNLVAEARRWIGTNPTGRSSLWCAYFMNFVLERQGYQSTGSGLARSYASYGRRIAGPQVGAIAVMSRGKNGGHVGVVSGIDEKGNPIIISGNHNKRVAEAVYPRHRIYAYVLPQ